jgi:hypothetical protein
MKRLVYVLALALMATLGACNAETPSSIPADTPTQKAEATANPAITEADGGEDLPWWDGFDFGPNLEYREEIVALSDPGEYINAAEGAKYTFDAVRDNGYVPEYSDATQYTMVLVDIAALYEGGEECYVYRLDIDEPTGTLGAAYAYAYQSGNIYMEGYGGEFVLILGGGLGDLFPDEMNDPCDVNWWGEYITDEWSIGIVSYNGSGFRFEFYSLRDGHMVTDGVAAVYPDNPLQAEYENFEFWLSEDFNTIQVFVTLDTEFDQLGGDYNRIEN